MNWVQIERKWAQMTLRVRTDRTMPSDVLAKSIPSTPRSEDKAAAHIGRKGATEDRKRQMSLDE